MRENRENQDDNDNSVSSGFELCREPSDDHRHRRRQGQPPFLVQCPLCGCQRKSGDLSRGSTQARLSNAAIGHINDASKISDDKTPENSKHSTFYYKNPPRKTLEGMMLRERTKPRHFVPQNTTGNPQRTPYLRDLPLPILIVGTHYDHGQKRMERGGENRHKSTSC